MAIDLLLLHYNGKLCSINMESKFFIILGNQLFNTKILNKNIVKYGPLGKISIGDMACFQSHLMLWKKIYENEFVLSFYDIKPQKKIHALVIPKGKYINLDDFNKNASKEEIVGLIKGISIVAEKLGISSLNGNGYRTLVNINEDGGQEVPHLHFHLFGGEKVGKMVS